MNRREFLIDLPLSLPLASTALSMESTAAAVADKTSQWQLPPGVEYFTEQRLAQAIDVSAPLGSRQFLPVCYYFANYHPSPAQERYFGKGWTEYQLVKDARPMFPGHMQPRYPLWGYYNEAEVAWAERDIEAASGAGISAFMIDWFWYDGEQLLQEQLEHGFLKAANRDKLQFAIMWANTDWTNQYPPNAAGAPAILYKQNYSEAEMYRMTDYWIEHYFRQPNYLRVNGKPVVGLFILEFMVKALGGAQKTRRILDAMRQRSARAGCGGIYFVVMQLHTPDLVRSSGVDAVTRYHTYDEGYGQGYKLQVRKWVQAAEQTIHRWKVEADSYEVPYFPDCPVGWDTSARFRDQTCIYVDRSADQYERLLRAAKHFSAARTTDPPLIFLSTWNEWTEDHYLLPDAAFGYSYLEAVHRQFAR